MTITLPEGPERGGYTFVNWAFYSDGKTTLYKAGQSYSWYATQAGATYRLYATWSENSSTPPNTAPSLADGVSSTTSVSVCVGETYYVDLSSIFTDADGDALTYSVSKNDAAAVSAPEQYSYVATSAGSVTLKFVANDGEYSSEPYTVILAVTEPDEPDEPETTPGTAWIHTSSGWKRAVVWVYVGQPSKGSWKQAQPWAYNQNTWHKTTT